MTTSDDYQPEPGHRVWVRRWHVTGSLDPEEGTMDSERFGTCARTGRFHADGSFIFWLDDDSDHISPGHVFLGQDENHGLSTYLVTTVDPAWRAAEGALADVWDGEPAEVTIRRIRDGWGDDWPIPVTDDPGDAGCGLFDEDSRP